MRAREKNNYAETYTHALKNARAREREGKGGVVGDGKKTSVR